LGFKRGRRREGGREGGREVKEKARCGTKGDPLGI